MSIIEKQCKHCGSAFQFDYEPKGKGSGNKLRRPYCSGACAKTQKKLASRVCLPTRLVKTCVECGNEFYVPKCHSARELCSNACRHKHTAKALTKIAMLALTCESCKREFTSKKATQKFCSPKCFSASRIDAHVHNCEVCDKPITTKKSYTPRFCGKRCTREAQSRGMVASHVNGRSGFRTDLVDSPYFKSSFEADYYRYCVHILGVTPQYEAKTFNVVVDGIEKCYTPDFWFNVEDRYVELKGVREGKSHFSKLLNSNSRAREVVMTSGQRIDVTYMDDFYNELRRHGLYDTIPNLEHRNYAGTEHLIRKHV